MTTTRVEEVASADVVVVGCGLAGAATALRMAERGREVLLCSPESDPRVAATTSSHLAQGGLAAAIGVDDSPALHAADTVAAGAGLTEPDVASRITAAGPDVVARLLALGAHMDREPDGSLRLGLEGAHGRRRIVHAHGDSSGAEFLRATITAALAHPRVRLAASTRVVRILTTGGRVSGVLLAPAGGGAPVRVDCSVVVLATGGIGGQFAHTTNPVTSWGSGLALGLRAGARVRDIEMTQFHPTALAVGGDPMPLVSEAVRGEGVALVLDDGTPLPDPLAARDVVARRVWAAIRSGRTVYLDVPGAAPDVRDGFAEHFPTVTASCLAAGIDPRHDPVPVRPALHYHMGGLLVDAAGRTDVPGLLAVGEVASTGLHGANRLASNSLLEAVACADELAAGLDQTDATNTRPTGLVRDLSGDDSVPTGEAPTAAHRRLMEEAAGLHREAGDLRAAWDDLAPAGAHDDASLVGALLVCAAWSRTESRGAHHRVDHPATGVARHSLVDVADLTTGLDSTRGGATGGPGHPTLDLLARSAS